MRVRMWRGTCRSKTSLQWVTVWVAVWVASGFYSPIAPSSRIVGRTREAERTRFRRHDALLDATSLYTVVGDDPMDDAVPPLGSDLLEMNGTTISTDLEGTNDWLNTVSDAEALLACHWQQKRTSGDTWTAGQERKRQRLQQRQRVLKQFRDADHTPTIGFFWDNVQELTYFQHKTTTAPDDTVKSTTLEWESADDDDVESSNTEQDRVSVSFWDEDDAGHESSVPDSDESTTQSFLQHQKRSHISQQLFANASWKASWYERRWGGGVARHNATRVQHQLEERVRRRMQTTVQMEEFLSQQVATMSEDEIVQAIQTYRQSKVKRAHTRRQGTIPRSSDAARPNVWVDWIPQPSRTIGSRNASCISPAHALAYLQRDWVGSSASHWDRGGPRSEQDWFTLEQSVNSLLDSGNLAGRKETIRNVLRCVFYQRGKCVPTMATRGGEPQELRHVTQATVSELILHTNDLIQEQKVLLKFLGLANNEQNGSS